MFKFFCFVVFLVVLSISTEEKQIKVFDEHSRLSVCMENYVDGLGQLFGTNRTNFVRMRMLEMMTTWPLPTADQAKMVFGIGPGSSGTRSLYLAFMQLNISSRHFWDESVNCGTHFGTDIELDFNILQGKNRPSAIFWSDYPVPNFWWQFYFQFPNARFIMTDADDNAWYKKRMDDHCNRKIRPLWDQCTTPLPFVLPYNTPIVHNFRRQKHLQPVFKEIYESMHLMSINTSVNSRAFQLYRQLVRCVIPQERLLWLNMSALPPSRDFWTQLVDFTGIEVSRQGLELMIGAGVPHQGTKGCKFSGKKCQEERRDGFHYVYPSVCYNLTAVTHS